MNQKQTRVVVAMSGGVDSSVTAGLLQRQGYELIGVTLVFRPEDDTDESVSWCCDTDAQNNARAVCETLGIPHHTINCATPFEEKVLKPAWDAYRNGETPSPCIICNDQVKFRTIYDFAQNQGARYIATGHYAVIEHGEPPLLRRGTYAPKDQTYFLYALDKEILNSILFPLGRLTKAEVRALAKEMSFINAKRPESQDACFGTSEGNFADALRHRFNATVAPGDIVRPDGKVLGRHQGIYKYTVGQRKGLGISLGHRAWVAQIDAAANVVVLSDDEQQLMATGLTARDVKWTGASTPDFPLRCQVQIRYNSPPVKATVTPAGQNGDNRIRVIFDAAQKAVAKGQAVVMFATDRVLGGGWITAPITAIQRVSSPNA